MPSAKGRLVDAACVLGGMSSPTVAPCGTPLPVPARRSCAPISPVRTDRDPRWMLRGIASTGGPAWDRRGTGVGPAWDRRGTVVVDETRWTADGDGRGSSISMAVVDKVILATMRPSLSGRFWWPHPPFI